jgi:hypothetical protein
LDPTLQLHELPLVLLLKKFHLISFACRNPLLHVSHALYRHHTTSCCQYCCSNNPCLSLLSPPGFCLQEPSASVVHFLCALYNNMKQHHKRQTDVTAHPVLLVLHCTCRNPLLHFSHALYRHITQHHKLLLVLLLNKCDLVPAAAAAAWQAWLQQQLPGVTVVPVSAAAGQAEAAARQVRSTAGSNECCVCGRGGVGVLAGHRNELYLMYVCCCC